MAQVPNPPTETTTDLPVLTRWHLLLVAGDEEDALILQDLIDGFDEPAAWRVDWCPTAEEGLEALSAEHHALCLGLFEDHAEGLEFARLARSRVPEMALVQASFSGGEVIQTAPDEGLVGTLNLDAVTPTTLEAELHRSLSVAQRTRRVVRRDPVTGLHNLVSFDEQVSAFVARAVRGDARFAVCSLRVLGWERLQSQLGGPAADEVLRTCARRVEAAVRPYDVAARGGGAEFMLLLELDGIDGAAVVVERLERSLAEALEGLSPEPALTVATGLASFPRDGADALTLRRVASSTWCDREPARGRAPPALLPLDADELTRALAAREFGALYQPQVDIQTGDLVGVELLARWRPSEGRPAPIGSVVAELEKAGTIAQLDRWAFERASRLLAELPALPRVSVNLSPVSLANIDFVSELEGLLPSRPGCLEVELTESPADPGGFERVVNGLHVLRRLGVRIALDDFGRGQASFERLLAVPADTIKIDRVFVQHLGQEGPGQAIVASLIGLGKRMGQEVVMEGVETAEQDLALRRLGGVRAQGFLYGRPMTEVHVRQRLAA
ncbi:MAG: bifunctional diguanylate cyclase/phosphodiesterase [Myxococcota bacterium]